MQRRTPYSSLLGRVTDLLKAIYRFAGRIVLGGVALLAAGIVALTMAVLGVLITIAAIIARLTKGPVAPVRAHAYSKQSPQAGEEGVILDARNTDHGWTVE